MESQPCFHKIVKLYASDYDSNSDSVASVACEQALCLGKNSEEREGKGGREPVDKHLRPLFRPLVIILPIICQNAACSHKFFPPRGRLLSGRFYIFTEQM